MNKLRQRFIRIAMLSLAGVLVFFTAVVNGANIYLTFLDQQAILDMIREEQGNPFDEKPLADDNGEIPEIPENLPDMDMADQVEEESLKTRGEREGRFNKETPYTTRFFVLRFDDNGNLSQAELESIAEVTEDNVAEYLNAAVNSENGYGIHGNYLFYTEKTGDNHHAAYFLDCYQQIRSLKIVLILTLSVDLFCIVSVYLILLRFSKKAVDPIVRNNAAQKQFITDAGHELKTPLTVLTTNLKLLEMETGESKWITKAQNQTKKLVELVNILIELSRMDETDSPIERHDFDLSAAAEEIVDSFRDYAEELRHKIEVHIEKAIIYNGDERAIRRLLTLLVDNAVKYARDGAIVLRVKRQKNAVHIQTENTCDAFNQDNLEKLFDRFYRPVSAANQEVKGFGIGLSAAKSIAEAHKGNIKVKCPEEGKIQFEVILK